MHCDRFVVCFHCSGAGRGYNECSQEGLVAHDCPETMCFNCDNLGHESRQCPGPWRCCICKSSDHLVDKRKSAPSTGERVVREEVIMETNPFDLTTSEDSMEPSPASRADTSEPGWRALLLYPSFVMAMWCLLPPQLLSLSHYTVMWCSLIHHILILHWSPLDHPRSHVHTLVDPGGQSFVLQLCLLIFPSFLLADSPRCMRILLMPRPWLATRGIRCIVFFFVLCSSAKKWTNCAIVPMRPLRPSHALFPWQLKWRPWWNEAPGIFSRMLIVLTIKLPWVPGVFFFLCRDL